MRQQYRLQRLTSFILSLLIVVGCISVGRVRATTNFPTSKITLYYLYEQDKDFAGDIPADYLQEYKVDFGDESINDYIINCVDGYYYFNISNDGVISPGTMPTLNLNTGVTTDEYMPGTYTIEIAKWRSTEKYTFEVEVKDYAVAYYEDAVKGIADSICKSSMSDSEKIEAITKYVAENYDYSPYYSSGISMYKYGGGDCWASCGLITALCEAAGIDAWIRNANQDMGAGSGHRNVVAFAKDSGKYYLCDAGFNGAKPRYYSFGEKDSLYSYWVNEDSTIRIYQYDGKPGFEELVIPSSINGHTVTALEQSVFYGNWDIKKVVLPDTLTTIDDYAFSGCNSLEEITIPKSVSEIGRGAFAQNTSLKNLVVDSDNPYLKSVDGAVYTKDGTRLVSAQVANSINIPSTVTSIDSYAFYYNDRITSIVVPSSVTSIGEGGFGNMTNLTSLTFEGEGLKSLGGFAFASCENLKSIVLPSSLESIEYTTFVYNNSEIALLSDVAPSIDEQIYMYSDRKIYVKKSATGFDGNWINEQLEIVRCDDPVATMLEAIVTPTPEPTEIPTVEPTAIPTTIPVVSTEPTIVPTNNPTVVPTTVPGNSEPTVTPVLIPTNVPSVTPAFPTEDPSLPVVSVVPSVAPSTPKPTTDPSEGVAGFAERLYTTCLGRKAEQAGKDYWISELRNGKTGAEVASGFFFSPEFINMKLSDKEYITRLYRTFMNREPDKAGIDYWISEMKNGKSRELVFAGFIDSPEWADICLEYGIRSGGLANPSFIKVPSSPIVAFAERLYTTCLGRDAEPDGLSYWAYELANLKRSGTEAAKGFFFSPEFIGLKTNNDEFVTRLYRTFMGREPEQEGFDYWVGLLDSTMSRADVFEGFSISPEFAALCSDAGIIR